MRQSFDTTKPFVVREPFRFAGTPLERGAAFDWRHLGCDERKLHQLWDQRFVECGELPAALRPAPADVATMSEAEAELEAATAPAVADRRRGAGRR